MLDFIKDSFTFTSTGMRIAFDLLAQKPENDKERASYESAQMLKSQGLTLEQIADRIGSCNRGAVSKLLKKGKSSGWDSEVSQSPSL